MVIGAKYGKARSVLAIIIIDVLMEQTEANDSVNERRIEITCRY